MTPERSGVIVSAWLLVHEQRDVVIHVAAGKLLPLIPEDFELLEPKVNVQYANCREVDWMAGGDYRLIQATAGRGQSSAASRCWASAAQSS